MMEFLRISIAGLTSVSLHTCMLIVCALITLSSPAAPSDADEGTLVAIAALATETLDDRGEEKLDDPALRSDERSDDTLEQLDVTLSPLMSPGDTAIDSVLSITAPSGAGGGGSGSAAGLDDLAAMASGGTAFDGQATFMGVQAQGRRFCIIADRSGSMAGIKFDFLKRELMKTIDDMHGHTRLQIVLFNTRALPYPRPDWLHPRDERDAVDTWLGTITAGGDTFPTPAFVQAFGFEPLPDAIFFMTDGQFDPRVVTQIRRLNVIANRTVPIHTITFVDRSAAGMMKTIASESGGTYRHVAEFKAP